MQSEVLAPAVKGTLNVLQACSANNVQKAIVVSSTAAVRFNPSWPQDRVKDESCWSDKNLCIKNEVSNIIFTFFITQKYPSILQFIINSYMLINATRED